MENGIVYDFHTDPVKGKTNEKRFSRSSESKELDLRRQCGCIRTSEKLKRILDAFPTAPPPSPSATSHGNGYENTCISAYCTQTHYMPFCPASNETERRLCNAPGEVELKMGTNRSWQVIIEVVQLVQLSVTATALALYYLIYCYMQLVYYTLRTALYFHNADGPMKITIGVVTLTSLVVGFNLLIRMERLIGLL